MQAKPSTLASTPYFNPKTVLLYLLIGLQPLLLHAQTFSVTPNPIVVEADLNTISNPIEIYGGAIITNDTTATLNLKWERVVNDIPDCWESSILGVWIQSLPHIDSLDFDLGPGVEGLLNVHIFTTGLMGGMPYAGDGEVVLKITNRNDLSDTLSVVYQFSATGDNSCLTSLSEIELESLQIYPNPTSDFFYLQDVPGIQNLAIRDITGKQIRQLNVTPNQRYDVSTLPSGIYFVQLMDRQYDMAKTIKLVKP